MLVGIRFCLRTGVIRISKIPPLPSIYPWYQDFCKHTRAKKKIGWKFHIYKLLQTIVVLQYSCLRYVIVMMFDCNVMLIQLYFFLLILSHNVIAHVPFYVHGIWWLHNLMVNTWKKKHFKACFTTCISVTIFIMFTLRHTNCFYYLYMVTCMYLEMLNA